MEIRIQYDKNGIPKPFALGHCKECGKYVSPTWMIWEGDSCPLCGKPFHVNSKKNNTEA